MFLTYFIINKLQSNFVDSVVITRLLYWIISILNLFTS
jgi:hypothetical protein